MHIDQSTELCHTITVPALRRYIAPRLVFRGVLRKERRLLILFWVLCASEHSCYSGNKISIDFNNIRNLVMLMRRDFQRFS